MIEVGANAGEAVGPQRAMRATGLVVRMEHEVIDDELAAAGKEIRECFLAEGLELLILALNPGFENVAEPSTFGLR
jgi:hypothetical protein